MGTHRLENRSLMLLVGLQPRSTNLMPKPSLEVSLCAQRWQNLMQRNLPSSLVKLVEIKRRKEARLLNPRRRKKRRKRNLLMISQLSLRKKIHLNPCQKEPLILRSGRGFIPIMMRTNLSNGSGNTLIMRIIPSGEEIINTKKNSFASCCLFGKDNDSSISGIWVFKGHELAFELSEDWQIDYASYDWKKLDSKSEECKKLVGQYWKWEGEDQKGRAFNQGKILK